MQVMPHCALWTFPVQLVHKWNEKFTEHMLLLFYLDILFKQVSLFFRFFSFLVKLTNYLLFCENMSKITVFGGPVQHNKRKLAFLTFKRLEYIFFQMIKG